MNELKRGYVTFHYDLHSLRHLLERLKLFVELPAVNRSCCHTDLNGKQKLFIYGVTNAAKPGDVG
jgi:hypothetical protein